MQYLISAPDKYKLKHAVVNHEPKAAAKFLRILLDENLRWYQHIDYIKLKISRRAWLMHTIRKHLFVPDMETPYCAIVRRCIIGVN